MTEANTTRFNAEAAAWDRNPDVRIASKNALEAILRRHPRLGSESAKSTDVIEIGCGTGLLTLPLAPYVRSILAIDASDGMIDALKAKLHTTETTGHAESSESVNIQPLCVMLEDPEDARLPAAAAAASSSSQSSVHESSTPTRKKFDIAVSHLTLHHIPHMDTFLRTILGTLKPGSGEVFITDFEDFGPDARRFHPGAKMASVMRDGIKKTEIERVLSEVGFVDVRVEEGWRQWKDVERWEGEWGEHGNKETVKERGEKLERMEIPFLVMSGRRGQ